ncbi:hypothetical protein DDB_G0286853 [Dictyostelium discoideum AX4]|uniref:Transmembrane protein n=1 Tax=Dictyostelium discoideum TaxID=44689 RepID=Q54L73_DICDI|nr:hypothetical protein DDB_G0286853 [Dictyostelium discoideum AX4]EAL64024.1 hypothetical protein DDB_G0286853 [Dictyostelium discoideum AX4]|eukprot:XP_637530.1 hypothetical protein DDB_G0286853 [Dictyostelium discoideum AX4]
MKLLFILLILTITIKNCLSININDNNNQIINLKINDTSYSMVPYQDEACANLEESIGFTFPSSPSKVKEVMTVFGQFNNNFCVVISNDGSGTFEIEWYIDQDCSNIAPKSKPYSTEQYQIGKCLYSSTMGSYYTLTETDQVQFDENTLIIQDTIKQDNSKCNSVREGYYSFVKNSTQFQEMRGWVTFTDTYYCTDNLQPFCYSCSDEGCNQLYLEQTCVQQDNFNIKCFGSSSSSSF